MILKGLAFFPFKETVETPMGVDFELKLNEYKFNMSKFVQLNLWSKTKLLELIKRMLLQKSAWKWHLQNSWETLCFMIAASPLFPETNLILYNNWHLPSICCNVRGWLLVSSLTVARVCADNEKPRVGSVDHYDHCINPTIDSATSIKEASLTTHKNLTCLLFLVKVLMCFLITGQFRR